MYFNTSNIYIKQTCCSRHFIRLFYTMSQLNMCHPYFYIRHYSTLIQCKLLVETKLLKAKFNVQLLTLNALYTRIESFG